MGWFDWFTSEKKPVYKVKDFGEVPQKNLFELGYDYKYAVDPARWEAFKDGQFSIASGSYPFQTATVGDEVTFDQIWQATPAFKDNCATIEQLLAKLLK